MKPYKVKQRCPIGPCWTFTDADGLPHHGTDEQEQRAKARAMKKAARQGRPS